MDCIHQLWSLHGKDQNRLSRLAMAMTARSSHFQLSSGQPEDTNTTSSEVPLPYLLRWTSLLCRENFNFIRNRLPGSAATTAHWASTPKPESHSSSYSSRTRISLHLRVRPAQSISAEVPRCSGSKWQFSVRPLDIQPCRNCYSSAFWGAQQSHLQLCK